MHTEESCLAVIATVFKIETRFETNTIIFYNQLYIRVEARDGEHDGCSFRVLADVCEPFLNNPIEHKLYLFFKPAYLAVKIEIHFYTGALRERVCERRNRRH